VKNEHGWTINRLIDNCRMRCSLAENTRPPWHSIYTPTVTLELVRDKSWGTSGFRLQPPDRNVETGKRWVLLHHTTSIIQVLYIPPCAVHTATHARDLAMGWHFLRTKITRWFGFLTPFEIAPTRVYYRELLVHSLEKEVIREGEGVCEG
jgi:hypothetical protein